MEENMLQTIYINIDDSGKLVNSEKVAIYAGLVFTSKKEKDKFSIFEELKYGIYNFNYANAYLPLINSELEVNICYQKSEKSYLIQAADLIAGNIRRVYLNNINDITEFNKRINYVNYSLFLP